MPNYLNFLPIKMLDKLSSVAAELLLALLILWLGWKLAARVSRMLRNAMAHTDKLDATLRPILASAVDWTLKILVIALALSQLGVQMAAIAALIGAAGLAIGLALQGTLQNIAAGIMLLLLRPFVVGDYIESEGGIAGSVREIGLFNTQLEKSDGIYLFVPNSKLWSGTITNFSRHPLRRLDIQVQIDFRADLTQALQVLERYLKADARVLAQPAPQVMVSNLSNISSEITLRAWSKSSDYWNLRYALNAGLRKVLQKAGVSMSHPSAIELAEQEVEA